MNKAEDIEQLIYRELPPDRYCYIHNFIVEKDKEIERLNNIIKELRKMLEHKVEFHKNLDFYEDKDLETQAYYNYVACLQDFDEIVEKYKLGKW